MDKIKRDGILPDDLVIERAEINNRMIAKINRNEDAEFIFVVSSHLIKIDNYVRQLQIQLIGEKQSNETKYNRLQRLLDQIVKAYKEILQEYKSMSNQEIKNIKWITKAHNRLTQQHEKNQTSKKRGFSSR